VGEIAAAWDPPDDIADDGAPEPGSEPHHVLYLNTFVAPELQFSQSALEKHYNWTEGWGTIPPCAIGDKVCLLAPEAQEVPGPAVDQSGTFWSLDFVTGQGDARIEERRWNAANYGGLPRNLHRLTWMGGQLDLPEHTAIGLPDADEVDLVLRFGALRPANPPVLKRMEAVVAVKLRGRGVVSRIRVSARIDATSPCSFVLEVVPIEQDPARLNFTAGVERCQQGTHELAVQLSLVASDYVHLIDEVTIEGAFLVWDDQQIGERPLEQLVPVFERLQASLLFRLEQICFRRSRTRESTGSTAFLRWTQTAAPDPTRFGTTSCLSRIPSTGSATA
jgi:hypothetical protein